MASPWATGWDRPPDIAIVQDPWGLALIAGLVIKEVPFLLLMTLAALGQVDARRTRLVASGLGYGRVSGWLKTVFPRIYPQIRLPVYAVLAYSMSVVDVAIILAPTTPPPLAVRLVTWFDDPDLSLRFQACAGAVLQLGLVIGAIGLWRLGEIAAARLARRWIEGGGRGLRDGPVRLLGAGAVIVGAGAVMLGAAGLTVWSFAGYWRFPDALPRAFTLRIWERRGSGLIDPLATTVGIGAAATLVAIVLCLACLENEGRPGRRPGMRALWLLYVPLIVPQTGFLFGLQMLVSVLGGGYHLSMLVLCHLVFVLPYVFLSLSDPYRAWDVRLGRTAACLGARPGRVFWRVRLPMLTAPVLTAAAVGFAVSVGQYLPTLLIGGGRFTTITTEAVALAAGGDRRLIGVYALMQMVLPFIAFSLAVAVPGMLFRRRRGMGVSP